MIDELCDTFNDSVRLSVTSLPTRGSLKNELDEFGTITFILIAVRMRSNQAKRIKLLIVINL